MATVENLLTDHIDLWTTATKRRSGAGRGSSSKIELYGIKKLRELVLELAVRGLLVRQDTSEEPANELLNRIHAEKTKLYAEGKIKKGKATSPVLEKDFPFLLPPGWIWVRLGDITNFGKTVKSEGIDDNVWVLDLEDIEKDTSNLLKKIRFYERRSISDKNSFKKGDVLYGKLRPYLNKVIVADEDGVCTTEILPIRCYGPFNSDYFKTVLRSAYFLEYVNARSYGMKMPRLGTEDGRQAFFPLPPLSEQYRIVAKVDELIALCDSLEQQTNVSLSVQQTLVESLLNALVIAADHDQFANAWQHISEYFDTLFTSEESIDLLKQTILQVAVMGKLVSQDPNDEPASDLLKKVAAEKAMLVKEGKIRNAKPLPPIADEEMPFELPSGWAFCRLQELVSVLGDGLHGTPNYNDNGDYYFINGNNLNGGKIVIKSGTKRVDLMEFEKHRKDLSDRTVFVSINGTIGNVAFYSNEPVILGKSACYFNLLNGIEKLFIQRVIESRHFFQYAASQATGSTISNLGLKAMNFFPIPLPHMAEQKRIVAKVDELLTLCDRLKFRLSEALATQLRLSEALTDKAFARGG